MYLWLINFYPKISCQYWLSETRKQSSIGIPGLREQLKTWQLLIRIEKMGTKFPRSSTQNDWLYHKTGLRNSQRGVAIILNEGGVRTVCKDKMPFQFFIPGRFNTGKFIIHRIPAILLINNFCGNFTWWDYGFRAGRRITSQSKILQYRAEKAENLHACQRLSKTRTPA